MTGKWQPGHIAVCNIGTYQSDQYVGVDNGEVVRVVRRLDENNVLVVGETEPRGEFSFPDRDLISIEEAVEKQYAQAMAFVFSHGYKGWESP